MRKWTTLFLVSLSALALAYLVSEISLRIWSLSDLDIPVSSLAMHFFLKLPTIAYQIAPVASLIATLLTITGLKQTRELGALCSSGISDLRIGLPLLAASFAVSLLSFYVGETIAPSTLKLSRDITREGKGAGSHLVGTDRIWLLESNRVIHIRNVELDGTLLIEPTILQFSGKGLTRISKRIDAPNATWEDGTWIMENGIIRHFEDGRLTYSEPAARIKTPISIKPEEFFQVRRTPEEMSRGELSRYIENLKYSGLAYHIYEVQMHSRAALALIPLIFGLIALPIGFQVPVRGAAPLGMGISIAITVIYWSFLSLALSLGDSGMIPAVVSAWSANVLFSVLGVLGFAIKRTPRLT